VTRVVRIMVGEYCGLLAYVTDDDGEYLRVTPIEGNPLVSVSVKRNAVHNMSDPVMLTDSAPRFYDSNGRKGAGILFTCPCGECGETVAVDFINPLDGSDPVIDDNVQWVRAGNTFDDMSLNPSLDKATTCEWNGYLINGEFIKC